MKENIILNDQILSIDVSNIGHWSMECRVVSYLVSLLHKF